MGRILMRDRDENITRRARETVSTGTTVMVVVVVAGGEKRDVGMRRGSRHVPAVPGRVPESKCGASLPTKQSSEGIMYYI